MKFLRRMFLILFALTLLVACGGDSGGDGDTPPEPTDVPADTGGDGGTTDTDTPEDGDGDMEDMEHDGLDVVLLPKFLGILVFDQAYDGALEAAKELGTADGLEFLGPTPENSVQGQIEIVTTAATQGQQAIMISNNAGDQLVPAAQAARDAGMTVVTWDSPIPSAEGEDLFIAQVDFNEMGTVMADMALSILGGEGKFAVLSASPDASNQNAWIDSMVEALTDEKYAGLELLDIVYGNDQSEDSYNQALALVDKYPDMGLIMSPTTVGITSASKAMQDEGLCDTVKVSGLGLPSEMVSYTMNGCAPEFALWSFIDLGYLTYYATHALATGMIEAKAGESFDAGRMGTFTIEEDPTRDAGLRVLMGPFTIYTKDNIEAEAGPQESTTGSSAPIVAETGMDMPSVLLPKFLGISVFDEANAGAQEAAAELGVAGPDFLGPTPENSVQGQIEIVTTAATQGQQAIMISNNAGDQLAPAAQAAQDAGMTVVTWDSPIPSSNGEDIFVAQVDFNDMGSVMADMALSILDGEGQFAVLSASPDASNQNAWIESLQEALANDPNYANLELIDIVYGNDQSEDSYNQALALVDKYPDMGLIMSPTTVGITSASKAMQDEDLCDTVKVSGLGLPSEMASYTRNGCAPEFALWSFVDLGYLTYYTTYLLATGQMEATVGTRFEAGRMGTYTIEKDPTRDAGLRVLMGPFTIYTADNIDAAVGSDDSAGASETITAVPGRSMDAVFLPKFLGIIVFDEANEGAQEAAAELGVDGPDFLGPTPENSVQGQIEILTNATTQGMDAIMISNNAGDQLSPAALAARDAGMTVITWDSPIPSAEGEDLFIAQVDFNAMGVTMADMALSILGGEGSFAVLSASPDAANQNAWIDSMVAALDDPKYAGLELLDIVYGNDQSEDSYNQALALVDKYPEMGLIMSPTTVGITSASKAMQDEELCDTVKVSGLGLPSEMASYTLNGCAPEFALWSFVDLGYLTYYTTYLIATGQMEAKAGVTFEAGRMGTFTIEEDPTRDSGLRVLMGPFTIYTADNVE